MKTFIHVLAMFAFILVIDHAGAFASVKQAPATNETVKSGDSQPLRQHQGHYFKWAAPDGWRASESNAGVTLTSPDGKYSAALASVLRSQGSRSPRDFLNWVFTHVPDYRNARVVSVKNLPVQHMSRQTWHFIEAVVSYTDKGLPVTGVWKVGTSNHSGMSDAMIVGWRAATPQFEQARSFLPKIAAGIYLTNGAEANGNNTLLHPKNNPLDNSALLQAGRNRDASRDRNSENWREGMMGTEPTYDPKTGKTYNSNLNDYNGARGGYVNPERPDELLQRGWPGHPKN